MITSRRHFVKTTLGASATLSISSLPLSASDFLIQKIISKAIPSSGEQIPVVGIGTSRRYDVGTSEEERTPLRDVLKQFPKLGGKLVDTASSYGKAEEVVGDLVSEIGNRQDLFFATKVRQQEKADGIAEMERSFSRLKTDKIDLMQIHNLMGFDNVMPVVREWKQSGRIRYVGASTSNQRQYTDFEAMMKKETLDFIQINYSLDDRTAANKILPLAADRGMAVLINLPYGRGRLFDKVGDMTLPEWAADFDIKSWGQFFLKYIVSHPAVTCAIPGTAKPKYLTDNFGAAMGSLPDTAARKKMEQLFDSL
ncbi:MAG: aldo/keto reductase [Bacteroidetes bacterium]|nr:aldo/keto reductase [Bacteroidota bacterium]MDA1121510.1 aldo/keto reductase [Bacteroidota bacterium]